MFHVHVSSQAYNRNDRCAVNIAFIDDDDDDDDDDNNNNNNRTRLVAMDLGGHCSRLETVDHGNGG